MTRNQETWVDLIYDLPFLRAEAEAGGDYDLGQVWAKLDELEREGRLRQLDIMILRSILEHLHNFSFNQGFTRGQEE